MKSLTQPTEILYDSNGNPINVVTTHNRIKTHQNVKAIKQKTTDLFLTTQKLYNG